MIDQPLIRRNFCPVLSLLMALGAVSARPAYGQTIFSAREFFFTRQFKLGTDIWPEPAGPPMALHSRGIYVAGAFQIRGLDFQASLRRYDLSGNEIWTRQVPAGSAAQSGLAAESAFPAALAVDETAVYLAGYVGLGHTELFVRKYDEGGNEVWSRPIRVRASGYFSLAGMVLDPAGLYLATTDGFTGLLRKYSPAGDELWSRPIAEVYLRGLSADVTGVYIAGFSDRGGFVGKYTPSGDLLWTRKLDSETDIVLPTAVAADSTGVYVGGSIFPRAGEFLPPATKEAFLRKLDASGNEVWGRRFGPSSFEQVVSVALDATGIYMTGWTQRALPGQCRAGSNDVFVRKYDTAGNEQWTRQFGTSGNDFAGSVAVDSTGVYISGGVRGGAAHGSVFLAKLGKTQTVASDPRPQISWECVVNAASYAGGGVAAGEIVTIFGRAMGPPELTPLRLAEDGRLATTLADTRIRFNGVAAPLLYVSATQSSAIVPYAVAEGPTVVIDVEYRGVRSESLTLPVAAARPGIFAINASGSGQGAILNEDGSPNSPENPASRGSIIVVYATGEGLTDPAGDDGAILGGVLPKPRQPVSVLFDDPRPGEGELSPAEVLYAGGVSRSVAGLLQVNVRVPPWALVGNAVSVCLQIGSGGTDLGVTVAVRE